MSIESNKLQAVCAFLSTINVEYAFVGEDPVRLLVGIDGDVDIVVRRVFMDRIHSVISNVCEKLDLQCVQVLQHEPRAFYFVVTWLEEQTWRYLRLDICDDYVRSARPLMTADEMLAGRIQDEASGFYIPDPQRNLLYYLLKKIDKGAVSDEQFAYLRNNLTACDRDVVPELCRFWSEDQAQKIFQCLETNDLSGFESMISTLQITLRDRCRPSFKSTAQETKRIFKRIVRPTGVWIAVYGPDGCGKSSMIAQLKPALLHVFRRTAEYHFRPYIGYPESEEVVTVPDPHGKKPRHPITSVLKLFYYATDYVVGYLLKVMPARIRSVFVVFDRYYDDLMVDSRRYCYGGPKHLLKGLRSIVPTPDLVFCLDADPEVLQDRKKEVSFEECKRQREAYRDLAEKLPNGHVIDASQPLEDVVRDVQSIVLNYMAERTTQRFGSHRGTEFTKNSERK